MSYLLSAMWERTPVLTIEGVKELRNIRSGDRIWNGVKYVKVESVVFGKSDGYAVNTGKGNVIKCSAETKFFSDGENVEAKNITGGVAVDNIELYPFTGLDPVSDVSKESEINLNDSFVFLYGLWCACGFLYEEKSVFKFHKITDSSYQLMEAAMKNLGYQLENTAVNEYLVPEELKEKFDKIQGSKRKASICIYHLVKNEVFIIFFYGFLSGRGYIKVLDDNTFNVHFSTNNEKIVYGIQFELYKRFGMRMSVRLSENSRHQKVFKCTIIGGDKIFNNMPELLNLFDVKEKSNLVPQEEYALSKASIVKPLRFLKNVSLELSEETSVPVYGYIKIK